MKCGTYPKRYSTVTSEVLAKLIDGEKLTGMQAVFEASTTRLAAKVHDLRRAYGWEITSTKRVVRTADGRNAEICEYSLPSHVIEAAMEGRGAQFCQGVKLMRAARRSAKVVDVINGQRP